MISVAKSRRPGTPRLVLLLVVSAVVLPSLLWAAGLTPQEERGRQIYEYGRSLSGRSIIAYFGKDLLEVPGESATCTSCHGHDGLGRTESGVIPANITWRHLMKSYGHIHPGGVEHPAFDLQNLSSYLRDGVFPGGRRGDPSMPVYDMADEDLVDLIAYNKLLGGVLDPGVSSTAIRVGTVLPALGAGADFGEVLKATIQAYFDDVNSQGGVYGRRLELVAAKVTGEQTSGASLQQTLARSDLFALVSTFTPGQEQELASVAEGQKIPLVAPYLLLPFDSQEFRGNRFLLFAGLPEQSQVLAQFATRTLVQSNPRIAVLYPERAGLQEIALAAETILRGKGWPQITRLSYAPGSFKTSPVIEQVQSAKPDMVLFLGDEAEAEVLVKAAAALDPPPHLFMPAAVLGRGLYQLPAQLAGKVWLAFASLPADRKEWGMKEFEGLVNRQRLSVTQPTPQLTAYVAAKLLVEGLRRAGRELSRERFLESLEKVFEFDTGLTPLISFGKNRRVGALGAHVVNVDPTKIGTAGHVVPQGWMSLK